MADLAADTAVTPLGNGQYRAVLPGHWNYRLPSGGAVMTVALRAMAAELGRPDFPLISATTLFCQPVPTGPALVSVDILRTGNIAAQLSASLAVPGLPGVAAQVIATFGGAHTGPEHVGAERPDVPDPTDCPDCRDDLPKNPHNRLRFYDNYDVRLVEGRPWWKGPIEPGRTRVSRWFRHRTPQTRADGTLDSLALPLLADTMPTSLVQGMGGEPRFIAPSLDLTLHVVADTRSEWLLVRAGVLRAHRGYASGTVEIWDEARELVAFGNQTMLFRRPSQKEPP